VKRILKYLTYAALLAWVVIIFFPIIRDMESDREPNGFWLSNDGAIIIEIAKCSETSEALCGIIKSLPGALDDEEISSNAVILCSYPLITGLMKDEIKGNWDEGEISDIENENFYSVAIWVKGQTLKVHAYDGLHIIGQTETWTSVLPSEDGCQ